MKKLKKWPLLLISVLFLLTATGHKDSDVIYWNENALLSWDDFIGVPDNGQENLAALTSSGIVYYNGCKDGFINYKVEAYFDKNESWVKPDAKTAHRLVHEQIHFDITELFSRKLKQLLEQRKFKCYEEREFKLFVDAFLTNWEVEQKIYDLSSRYSMNRQVQKEWDHKIQKELSDFRHYSE